MSRSIDASVAVPDEVQDAVRNYANVRDIEPCRDEAMIAIGRAIEAHVAEKVADAMRLKSGAAPAGGSYMERRIDAAGRYVEQINIGPAEAPHTGWIAVVKTDRIGSAEVAFARYADAPSDALDLALADAAAWVQVQKDIR